TSGMSAALNGALNISTPDGWMEEANPDNYFPFGSAFTMGNDQDAHDARELRKCVLRAVALSRKKPELIAQKRLAAKLEAEEQFSTDRMVREYAHLYEIELPSGA
ncbi:MAG: alpha-glucan family phosphorylase, partial [Candidatus Liptonbacteria bacterium]|nr:alpha-glucan family phosphorylase [Candidatus Liptonbacteria bacterium]